MLKKFFPLPPWMYKSGFTLIECSLVILLISFVMFLSGAHGKFLHRLLARTELEHLYTTCYYLQRKAMITGKTQRLTFEPQKKAYRYGMTRHYLPTHVCFGCPDGAKGPPAHPERRITNPITFKGGSMLFHPTGVMQAGTAYLTDSMRQHGFALSCAVAQVSYLRKYQYSDKWELL